MRVNPQTVTAVVLFAVLIFVGVYDLWASIQYGSEATVSTVIQDWSRRWPMIPFGAGVLAGHLFWIKGG